MIYFLMGQYFIITGTLAFIIGLWLARWVVLPVIPALIIALGALVLLSFFNLRPRTRMVVFLLALLSGGYAKANWDYTYRSTQLASKLNTFLELRGVVMEEPKIYPRRVVYLLEAWEIKQKDDQRKVKEKVEVVQYFQRGKAPPCYRYGDVLKVQGRLELPTTARNPGEFDYRAYLARRYIYTQVIVDNPNNITKIGEVSGYPWWRLALKAKERARTAITSALPPRFSGLLLALLFGDKEKLEQGDVDVFKTLGVMHVFAVSGLHVGFVLLFLMGLAGFMGLHLGTAVTISIAGLLFYAALAGFSPSITRAVIMGNLGLYAYLKRQKFYFYTSLSLAAFLILLFQPRSLYDTGFQLSFLATWGLVYFYPLGDGLLGWLPSWRRYLIVPLAAQIAVLPLTAYYFNLLPLLSLPANLITVALTGVVTLLGLASFLAAQVSLVAGQALAATTEPLLALLLYVLYKLGSLPGAALPVPTPSLAWIVGYYTVLILLREIYVRWEHPRLLWWRTRYLKAKALPKIIGFLVLITGSIFFFWSPSQDRELQVTFLDVGQGDAIYIRTPAGKHVLIDGGGRPEEDMGKEVGEKVVIPFLRHQGIRKLDVIISTHPDADHMGGLLAVVNKIPVSLVVVPPLKGKFLYEYAPLLERLRANNIPWSEAVRGDRLRLDDSVEVIFFNPAGVIPETRSSDNNYSLVTRFQYGHIGFLFSGDIEAEAMEDILKSGLDMASTVFQVPHHGSRFGLHEKFLEEVGPALVVISVGVKNSFGHPSHESIDYWQSKGIPILRTDQQGAITFFSNGWELKIKTRGQDLKIPAVLKGSRVLSPEGPRL
ncbi:competence protein ComEC [Thermanaeromonas toyohensis ToBE]|uniref:Competence protein ComEC n=1 Tax=Thermanaeromonas toyohensis ToBE TaxID=698762 RepID=A0A1W1VHP9_9FIRM|nr:DNA internalization-related competence protein ComEC/Rec2 [Thermanaeromonas toyohensis]SMB92897.1 competence protein ComEC [Thermanaeromonas toyohensis ToBE]